MPTPDIAPAQEGEAYIDAALRLTAWALMNPYAESAKVVAAAAQVYATLHQAEQARLQVGRSYL
jgi:hypothetical protein